MQEDNHESAKDKLFAKKSQQTKPIRSTLDDTLFVQSELWVVALCRKPKGKNSEHAFLIVEGLNSYGAVIFKRYDLFQNRIHPARGEVYIKPTVKVRIDTNLPETLSREILAQEEIYALAWSITKKQAKILHQRICADKKNPPHYFTSGDRSIFTQSLHSSEAGWHNCFTWAREKLLEIDDDDQCFAKTLPKTWESLLVSRTSKHIKGTTEPTSGKCLCM